MSITLSKTISSVPQIMLIATLESHSKILHQSLTHFFSKFLNGKKNLVSLWPLGKRIDLVAWIIWAIAKYVVFYQFLVSRRYQLKATLSLWLDQ